MKFAQSENRIELEIDKGRHYAETEIIQKCKIRQIEKFDIDYYYKFRRNSIRASDIRYKF